MKLTFCQIHDDSVDSKINASVQYFTLRTYTEFSRLKIVFRSSYVYKVIIEGLAVWRSLLASKEKTLSPIYFSRFAPALVTVSLNHQKMPKIEYTIKLLLIDTHFHFETYRSCQTE